MSSKQKTPIPAVSFVLVAAILIISAKAAIAPGADTDIKVAIQAAIQDGFNMIDADLRQTYWYYLKGSNTSSYKVIMKPDSINYVILYENKGNIFQVNCDLIKQTWQPRLNNFVKLASGASPNVATSNPILTVTNITVDLTNQTKFNEIAKKNTPQGVPAPSNEQIILPTPFPNLLSETQGK